jgi:hypothetical protein
MLEFRVFQPRFYLIFLTKQPHYFFFGNYAVAQTKSIRTG